MFNGTNMNAYQLLGIAADADERTIKRAYAGLIKQYRPDTSPAEFAQIRAAYEEALHRHFEQMQWADAQQATTVPEVIELEPESPVEEPVHATLEKHVQYAEVVQHSIAQMIRELEAHAEHASEKVMLSLYLVQADEVNKLTLDMQMDYEPHLLNWLLTTHLPSLLIFAAANARYDWLSKEFEIARRYGWEGGERFQALSQLAVTYQAVAEKRNSFVQIESEAPPPKVAVASNFSLREAQNLSQEWRSNTSRAEIPHLKNRITLAPPALWQIYWGDIIFALLIAPLVWLMVREQKWWEQLVVLLISAGVLVNFASLILYLKTKALLLPVIKSMSDSALWVLLGLLFAIILIPSSVVDLWRFVMIVIMGFPLILAYRLADEVEVKLFQWAIALRAGCRWLGRLNLAVRKKFGLYSRQHDFNNRKVADEIDLVQLKHELVAYLKQKPEQAWALSKAIPWWAWGIILIGLVRMISK